MKKFAISLLAVLAMLVCVVTLTAPQAQAAEDAVLYHCICGNKHSTALTEGEITYKEGTTACYEGCDGEILEWTAWSASSTTVSGNYYMISNHTTVRAFTTIGVNINVDMNGYNVQVTGTTRAINAGNGSTINYCNTKTTGGLITAPGYDENDGAIIKLFNGTKLNLYGVDVAAYNGGNDTTKNGGAVYVDNLCSFTMHDGFMTGCDVTEKGGSLFVNTSAVAKLYDVTISGGSAGVHGGNVYTNFNSTGTILMDGCTVFGGRAAQNGGNMWIGYAAKNDDGSENAELAKFINCTIYGGEAVSGGSVMYARRIAMNGGSIGVDPDGKEAGGVATNRGGNVFINDAELVMNLGAKIGFGNSGSTNGGNVFITGTGNNGKLTMNNTATVLNGKTTANGGNVYVNAGALSMGGTTQISGGDANYGGNIYMYAGEAFIRGEALIAGGGFSGTYGTNATATCLDGGNVYVNNGAYFLLSGKAIVRNGMDTGTGEQSGNFLVKGTLEIRGMAKVYGGLTAGRSGERNIHAISGAAVNFTNFTDDNGEYIVNDTAVRGGLTMGAGTTLAVEGTPYIAAYNGGRALYLASGVVVDATGLTDGAEIEIFDSAVTADRKIASITTDQTWIKDAIAIAADSALEYVVSRELITAQDGTQTVELWLRSAIAAQVQTNANGIYDYQSVDAAIADCAADETIIIDLKGQEITTEYAIPGDLKLVDSANADYTTQTGSFTGTVNGTVYSLTEADGVNYLVVENEGVYSAHCYDVQLTHVSLDAANDALGYKAALHGDDTVISHVTGFGFDLWVDGGQVKTYAKTGVRELTLRLKNIMAAGGGEMNINANAFVAFDINDDKITTATETTSMKTALSAVNDAIVADASAYTEAQVASVQSLIEKYSDDMSGWNIEAIKTWTAPVVDPTEAA